MSIPIEIFTEKQLSAAMEAMDAMAKLKAKARARRLAAQCEQVRKNCDETNSILREDD